MKLLHVFALVSASAAGAADLPAAPSFLRSSSADERSLQSGGCTDCVINGVGYCQYESYPDPTCLPNVCRCTLDEVDACTKKECQRNCAAQNKQVCSHLGKFYCAGDVFYDSTCMPNTCTCNADGTVTCAQDAGDCVTECFTDDDCTTVVRTQSAQYDLYPLCGCEARSALNEIASVYDECLGEGITEAALCASMPTGNCGNTCRGYNAVCINRKCGLVAPCGHDVMTCPDGSRVTRNAANDCKFDPCPESPSPFVVDPITGATSCKTDIELCDNGAAVDRDPDNGCEFRPCPACNGEAFQCNDGSIVSRDSAANCAFEPCSDGTAMPAAPAKEAESKLVVDKPAVQLCCDSDDYYLAPCKTTKASYCIGESFTGEDGCSSCICANANGQLVCNDKACYETPDITETQPAETDAPSDETEENISSNPNDVSSDRCTCIGLGGEKYCPGDTFIAPDGCNSCSCSAIGIASCTKKACIDDTSEEEADQVEEEETTSTNGKTDLSDAKDATSGSILVSAQASALVLAIGCIGGFLTHMV